MEIDEKGVNFRSHIDGSKHFISPEKAMEIQMALGSDIAMAFDECSPYPVGRYQVETAAQRTLQWAKRCKEVHNSPKQSLFGIVQGGAYKDLRIENARKLASAFSTSPEYWLNLDTDYRLWLEEGKKIKQVLLK